MASLFFPTKPKFQRIFKILAFLVHANNRNETNTIGGRVRICFYLTAGCKFTIISWWHQRDYTTVLEQEQPNASLDTSNIPLAVYFTSDFDNRRARLWMIKLTDWIVQRWSDDGKTYMLFSCDFGCIHNQSYFATYCDIWIGSSDAVNCTWWIVVYATNKLLRESNLLR